ncbi:MAG: hypothetical protein WBD20_20955 [Pirellulaceae bacterium]
MSKHSKSASDIFHIAGVFAPVGLLAVIVGSAVLSWRTHSVELQAVIRDVSNDGMALDRETLIRRHDAETSKDGVATWKAILSAAQAHNVQFGGPFIWAGQDDESYEFVVPPGEPWEAGEIVHLYAEGAKPILAKIETLLDSDHTIWTPLVGDSLSTLLPEVQQSRDVYRLLRYVFLDAIHQGDNETALMTIHAVDRLFGPKQRSMFMVGEFVNMSLYSSMLSDIRRSIAVDVWTDEQLAEIESLLAKPMQWDQRWAAAIQSETEMYLPALVDGQIEPGQYDNEFPSQAFKLAPSTLVAFVRNQQQLKGMPAAFTEQDVRRIDEIYKNIVAQDGDAAIDRLLQLPLMSSELMARFVKSSYMNAAGAFCRDANAHRFTRTVLAVRKFERKFDLWPESLDELSRVGLPRLETQAFDGGPFAMEVDDESQMVVYDQARSTAVYEGLSNQPADWVQMIRSKKTDP